MSAKKYRLLTNIHFVQMGSPISVRLHCHALLLAVPMELGSTPTASGQIRGFITDGAMEVFSHLLKCEPNEYETQAANNPNILMSTDAGFKPIFSGHILTFKDGTELSIIAEDREVGLGVTEYDDIREVWADLPLQVLKHWKAPYFPVSSHLSVDRIPNFVRARAM